MIDIKSRENRRGNKNEKSTDTGNIWRNTLNDDKENTNSTENRPWAQTLQKGRQFLLHIFTVKVNH